MLNASPSVGPVHHHSCGGDPLQDFDSVRRAGIQLGAPLQNIINIRTLEMIYTYAAIDHISLNAALGLFTIYQMSETYKRLRI